ncbi:MAG: aquaporin [Segniliparus sp.]|uniref:aquaporin n=1 Tax=Segniliparus sp. TaxID=2804064 RepID=UPI003F31E259
MTDHDIAEEEAVLLEDEAGAELDEDAELAEDAEFAEDIVDGAVEDEGPELADGGIARRVLAEFFGTFFLTLVIASASGPAAPVLVGLTAATLFFLFGPVSGGHFNPVVTVAAGLLGRIRGALAWVYLIVQFAAGFAAFALLWALRPPLDDAARAALRGSVDSLAGARQDHVPWFPAAWPLLILLPALLVAAVLAARAKFGQEPVAAGWIGAAVGATFWLQSAIYPAASLPDVVFNGYAAAFRALPVLMLFPLIGAYVGALLYRELVAPRPAALAADEDDEEPAVDEAEEPVGEVLDETTAAELAQSEQETTDEAEDSQPHESS